jgi:hypothetical protein
MRPPVRTLSLAALLWLTLPAPGAGPSSPGRVVYLAGKLSDEGLIVVGAALAAEPSAVLLLDSPGASRANAAFLKAYAPDRVVRVGPGRPLDLWNALFPRPASVVVCPARPRARLLQAACLAGLEGAPLWVTHDEPNEGALLRAWLKRWGARRVYLLGETPLVLPGKVVTRLPSAEALASACERRLAARGRVETAVVCNPADAARGGLSALAPWVAVRRRAVLLLTRPDGKEVEAVVERAGRRPALRRLETLILLADHQAIPTVKRPNPIPGDKDVAIEMEPCTPAGKGPFSFAVGRLFHKDRALVPLLLERGRLLARPGVRKALVASNPGGGLPLLETFSRCTAQELANAGYSTTGAFEHDLTSRKLRALMPRHDVVLWEGHHNTLIKDWGFPSWDEPLPPSFIFLQSCLALQEPKVQPLFTRGALAVVGTSTRTYSGSGGACSLAFFEALLHDGLPLGASLRQAKNFLLTYAQLKQRRLGSGAVRAGANLRAAWSFTLWGDPTLALPRPAGKGLPGVRHEVRGHTIVLSVPDGVLEARTNDYLARRPPGARLAGLVYRAKEGPQALVPLVFAEVHLPRGRPGQTPRLRSKLPATRWAFLWDARRRRGYLLALPRDRAELRFHVEWPAAEVARD